MSRCDVGELAESLGALEGPSHGAGQGSVSTAQQRGHGDAREGSHRQGEHFLDR